MEFLRCILCIGSNEHLENHIPSHILKQPQFAAHHPISLNIVTLPDSKICPQTRETFVLSINTRDTSENVSISMPCQEGYAAFADDVSQLFEPATIFSVRRFTTTGTEQVDFVDNPVVKVIVPAGSMLYKRHNNDELWVFLLETEMEADFGISPQVFNYITDAADNHSSNATIEGGICIRSRKKALMRGHKASRVEEFVDSLPDCL